ncbi:IclR family transcriptional regulator [Dactylosporangium darangshiense]|uniref:IclR family transcriptional regulator n=1 Tax=Dactylosporangium darangshiense TaxID=579108 RepID=UPI00363698CE
MDGVDVVYVERLSARGAVLVRSRVGGRLPAHTTGVGLVLLAHCPVDVLEQYLSRPLVAFTPLTIADPLRLRATLDKVRRSGHAVSDRQVQMDAVSVAAPVRDVEGRVTAALSVIVPFDGMQPAALVPAVVAAAPASPARYCAEQPPRNTPATAHLVLHLSAHRTRPRRTRRAAFVRGLAGCVRDECGQRAGGLVLPNVFVTNALGGVGARGWRTCS